MTEDKTLETRKKKRKGTEEKERQNTKEKERQNTKEKKETINKRKSLKNGKIVQAFQSLLLPFPGWSSVR